MEELKEEISSIGIGKLALLNLTNENIEGKLLESVGLYQYDKKENTFNSDEEKILKDLDFLFVVYDNEDDLNKDRVKHIIELAKERKVDVVLSNIQERKLDDVIQMCNEVANLICEPQLINIETNEIKGYEILDYLIEKREGTDFNKEYFEMFDKYVNKNKGFNRIAISITGGYDASLDGIYELVKTSKEKTPENTVVIFGAGINERLTGIQRICVIFQKDNKKAY